MTELYSERLELAFTTALEAHGLRRRKAGRGFEVSHVVSVALITADFNLDEDTVIAALLHDTLEDTDLATDVIESRFGVHVLEMVQDVTEPPKDIPWHDRKNRYIEQLRTTPRQGSLAIASADKIHNLSHMTAGIATRGNLLSRHLPQELQICHGITKTSTKPCHLGGITRFLRPIAENWTGLSLQSNNSLKLYDLASW